MELPDDPGLMKIIQLTAGTGSFHCGNCVRDNSLVLALEQLGHDCLMVPLYLPMVVDGPEPTAVAPLFYGGVNAFLQQQFPFFRKTPRWIDALFDSPSLLRLVSRKTGATKAKDLGELTVSTLKGEEGYQVKELDRLVEWLCEYGKPDVVSLSNALLVGMARRIKEALSVPVVCALQGEDGYLDALPPPYNSEAWGLLKERARDIDLFVAVSNYYAGVMKARLGLPEKQIRTIYNGISLDGYSSSIPRPRHPTIGYLARLCSVKGLDTLVEAFIQLKKRNTIPGLRLAAAGTMTDSDAGFVKKIEDRIRGAGCESSVVIQPNVTREEKIRFLESLSILSVPAVYGEAFGLYIIEALAAGVPFVQPDHAAFPELLAATGGGILYDHTDPDGLVDSLESLLLDTEKLNHLDQTGRKVVHDHFSMTRMAQEFIDSLQQLVPSGHVL